jgi:hypothetical protein
MAGTIQEKEVVSFEGSLDLERARIMLQLALDSDQRDIVLDLRRARDIQDAAIAFIAAAVGAPGRSIEVLGLRAHHRKLLALLRAGAAPWPGPAPVLPT